jgi:hypothetical protein
VNCPKCGAEHYRCSCYLEHVPSRPRNKYSSSTETQLFKQEHTIGSPGSTLQSLQGFALQNMSLLSEQRNGLSLSYSKLHLDELAVAALYIQRVIVNAITDAIARDSLSTASIGPKSPSERASPSPTTVKVEDAPGEKTGAIENTVYDPCRKQFGYGDYPVDLQSKHPDNLFGP